MSRALPSPRYPQPYSPHKPSPLGSNPPIAPHMAFNTTTTSKPSYATVAGRAPALSAGVQQRSDTQRMPAINEGYASARPRAPQVGSQPLSFASSSQRTSSKRPLPPAPLNLSLPTPNSSFLNERVPFSARQTNRGDMNGFGGHARASQPSATIQMHVVLPSPVPASATSSLSLYSSDDTRRRAQIQIPPIGPDGHQLQRSARLDQSRMQVDEQRAPPLVPFCPCLPSINFVSIFAGLTAHSSKAAQTIRERVATAITASASIMSQQQAQAQVRRQVHCQTPTQLVPNRRRPPPLNM